MGRYLGSLGEGKRKLYVDELRGRFGFEDVGDDLGYLGRLVNPLSPELFIVVALDLELRVDVPIDTLGVLTMVYPTQREVEADLLLGVDTPEAVARYLSDPEAFDGRVLPVGFTENSLTGRYQMVGRLDPYAEL